MGTSQSSGGPASGVPMVPPWTPAAPADPTPEAPATGGTEEAAPAPAQPVASPIAPSGRFASARRSLGDYASSGDGQELRRGTGHYVRGGYGGAATTTRRFGGTATTAAALGGALAGLAGGQGSGTGSPLDPALLAGRSADEVMDAVVEAVKPTDGTQDAEASRAAIRDALSELLKRFPNADLLNLSADERAFAIEQFTALDVFQRFVLDVGKTIQDRAPDATTALQRLREVRDYIREAVASSFRKLATTGRSLTSGRIGQVVRDALRDTFEIFEGYAE